MRNRALLVQSLLFATSCDCLLLALLWGIHFELFRLFAGIVLALMYLAAQLYLGYFVARRLWRWCGTLVQLMLRMRPHPENHAALTELTK